MSFKSELVSSNPLLYTSLFLLGFFPASNLISPSYYGCWDSLLLLHWVVHCSKLSVLLGFSPASNIWLLQVLINVGLPPYFWVSYTGLSLLLRLLTCFQVGFPHYIPFHSSSTLNIWCMLNLPIDLKKITVSGYLLCYLMVLKYALSSLVSVQGPELCYATPRRDYVSSLNPSRILVYVGEGLCVIAEPFQSFSL